jgi:DNA-binding CsgD family transcriptional regulator
MGNPIRQGSSARHTHDSGEVKILQSSGHNSRINSDHNAAQTPIPESQNEAEVSEAAFAAPLREQASHLGKDDIGIPRDVMLALTYGLELVRQGAMLVAFEGHPHLVNRAAHAILEKKDGLFLGRTGLIAERTADTKLLRKLLQDAITSPENGEPKDSPVTLPRKAAHNALIVRVVPGPGLDCWQDSGNRTALLTLYDQDIGLEVDAEMLVKLYGLTRGEAGLATHLVKGQSIEEAAAAMFISPHTARTHLKRIFMKTDTHRQTELVIRILSAVL